MFDRAFQRRQRLGPEAVFPTVPEVPGTEGRTDNGHRISFGYANTDANHPTVGKKEFRLMAGAAGNATIRAQPNVKEKPMTQRGSARIISDSIACIQRQRSHAANPQAANQLEFGCRPGRFSPGGFPLKAHCQDDDGKTNQRRRSQKPPTPASRGQCQSPPNRWRSRYPRISRSASVPAYGTSYLRRGTARHRDNG